MQPHSSRDALQPQPKDPAAASRFQTFRLSCSSWREGVGVVGASSIHRAAVAPSTGYFFTPFGFTWRFLFGALWARMVAIPRRAS